MINRFLWPLIIFSVAVAFFHILALNNDLYFSLWWYDLPMHFGGGIVIGFLFLWISNAFPNFPKINWENLVIFIFIVGVLWEIWELLFGLTSIYDPHYNFDTSHDLFLDILGTLVTFCYYKVTK